MKNGIINVVCLISIIFCGLITGCNNSNVNEREICAYIKSIDGKTVLCEEVEYITSESIDRIEELGLKETDMPNGYYINEIKGEISEYTLNDNTIYNIIDWNNQFVEEGSDRNYSTSNQNEFEKYMNSYENSSPGMPFFIKIRDKQIISITELMIP